MVFSGQSLFSQYPQSFLVSNVYLDNWVMVSYFINQNTLITRVNDNIH